MQKKPRPKETKLLSVFKQNVCTWHIMVLACFMNCCFIQFPAPCSTLSYPNLTVWTYVCPKSTLWDSCLHLAPFSALSGNPGRASLLLGNQSSIQPRLLGLCCTAWALLSCWAHRGGDFPGYFPEGSPHVPVLQLEWFANPLAVHNTGWCGVHEMQMKPRGEGAVWLEMVPGW